MDTSLNKTNLEGLTIEELGEFLSYTFKCRICIKDFMEVDCLDHTTGRRHKYIFNTLIEERFFVISGYILQDIIDEISELPYITELQEQKRNETTISSIMKDFVENLKNIPFTVKSKEEYNLFYESLREIVGIVHKQTGKEVKNGEFKF